MASFRIDRWPYVTFVGEHCMEARYMLACCTLQLEKDSGFVLSTKCTEKKYLKWAFSHLDLFDKGKFVVFRMEEG